MKFPRGEIFLASEADTLRCGARLADAVQGGDTLSGTIFLQGVLGAGKTTLSRGFLHGLGHTGAVRSPTYTLVEEYCMDMGEVLHLDLYRLDDAIELDEIGIRDYLCDRALYLVEWPERGAMFLPPPDLRLCLELQLQGRALHWSAESEYGGMLAARAFPVGTPR